MPVTDMDSIQPLFDAIQVHRKNYSSAGADYSVTTLLNPPRIVHLEKRHIHKVDRWVKEQLGSFIGTAIHNYFEECLNAIKNSPYKCEERLHTTIADRHISGAYDIIHLMLLDMYDLKTTSVWKAMFGNKGDWTAQQNMYRYMYWLEHKEELKTIRILAMFLDWSQREKMQYGRKYPNEKVVEYGLTRWSMQETYDYMVDRVQTMKDSEGTDDKDLPLCTYEDMWSKPDKYAVKAVNRKNALRVCDSLADAKDWVSVYLQKDTCKHKISQLSYEQRPSVRTRCEHWCPVNQYCNQYADYLTAMAIHNGGKK